MVEKYEEMVVFKLSKEQAERLATMVRDTGLTRSGVLRELIKRSSLELTVEEVSANPK